MKRKSEIKQQIKKIKKQHKIMKNKKQQFKKQYQHIQRYMSPEAKMLKSVSETTLAIACIVLLMVVFNFMVSVKLIVVGIACLVVFILTYWRFCNLTAWRMNHHDPIQKKNKKN